MKKIILLFTTIALSTFLQAQQTLIKDQQKVQETVVKFFEALSMRDSESIKNYCATDITFYEYGEIWDLNTLISKAVTQNTATDFKRSNTFVFINTKSDKNTAWLTYRLSSVITKEHKLTTVEWLETVILVKQKKQWKVKHLHSTLIKKA